MSKLGPGRRASRSQPCRKCGPKGAGECYNFDDGGTLCYHVESDRLTDGGYLHLPDGDDWRDRQPVLPPVPPKPKADPDVLDRAHRVLFDASPLSVDHHTQLLGRGWSNELIDRTPLGTLPKGDRSRIAAAVLATCPEALGVVPGLYRDRSVPSVYGAPGMLIGIVDEQGRVVGGQIRADDPGQNGRFRWLSSPDKDAGAGASAAVHVARPITRTPSSRVWITEGPLKATYAADRLGVTVLAVPGVNAIAGVVDAVRAVGATEVVLAFDRDTATNPKVARAEARMIETLQGAGFTVLWSTWSDSYKGIDDLLAAGKLPMIEAISGDTSPAQDSCADLRRQFRELSERHSAVMAVLGNEKLNPTERIVAVMALTNVVAAQSHDPDVDEVYVPVKRIAESAGLSESTVSKTIRTIESGLILPPVRADEGAESQPVQLFRRSMKWARGALDRETGELRDVKQTHYEPLVDNLTTGLRVLARAEKVEGRKHGGKRPIVCPDHPDAGVRVRFQRHCAECDRLLEEGERVESPREAVSPATDLVDDATWIDQPPATNVIPLRVAECAALQNGHAPIEEPAWLGDAPAGDSIAAAWLAGRSLPGDDGDHAPSDRYTDSAIGGKP